MTSRHSFKMSDCKLIVCFTKARRKGSSLEDIIQKRCEIFRFRKGMRAKLLNQVATDNPEGMGHSSKGWDVVVAKLKSSGPEWALLNARCARETTREAVKAWSKADRENREKTGTGENETEEDEFLREVGELWKERVDKEKESKLASSSKDQGLAIRRIATEGLKRRNPADYNEQPSCSASEEDTRTPVKRKRKDDMWSYMREVREGERKLEEERLRVEERRLAIQEQQLQLQKERQAQELLIQRETTQQEMQLQQQQLQLMTLLLQRFSN